MLISQLESLNVIKAPLPGILPENCSISFNILSPLNVTLKLSQFVLSGLPKKGSGLPRPGFFPAILDQSSPDIGLFGLYSGAVFISPKVEESVIHPNVAIQTSPSSNVITFSSPSSSI